MTRKPYLGNIAFWVSDFEKSRAFYSEIIGVNEMEYGEVPRKWALYGTKDFSFSVNEGRSESRKIRWAKSPMNPSLNETWDPYVTIYVPKLDEVTNRCRSANVSMRQEQPFSLGQGFGRSIEVQDPDGNTLAITEREVQ